MKSLHPFQTEARHKTNALLNAGISHVFVSPCGTGKTFTSTRIIQDRIKLGKRVYVIVPQVEIMGQWLTELTENGIDAGYINDEGMRGTNRPVYVCMFQSLINLLPMIPESLYPDEIFIDECQHTLAASIKTICAQFPHAPRVGLTATLYHGSGETFRPWFTESYQTITKREAIEQGYITPPVPLIPEDFLADADIPIVGEDYDLNAQAAALGKTRIIGDMIAYYERLFCGRPVLVPCATFEQSKIITKRFQDAGWNFEHLHSKLPKSERARILSGIARQEINGACTVGIGIEGLSIDGLYGIMYARRTLSPIIWTQFNGRAERLLKGKKHALIVDFVGNTLIHGHPAGERKWNLDGEEEEREDVGTVMKICPGCKTYNAVDNEACHWCGLVFDSEDADRLRLKRGMPAMVDGELIAITDDGEEIRIRARADDAKAGIKIREDEKQAARERLEEVSEVDKRQILKAELFKDTGRRRLFKEAIGGMV